MKRTMIAIGLIAAGTLVSIAGFDYTETLPDVGSAEFERVLIMNKPNRLQADFYWTIRGAQGNVLAENKRSTVGKDFATKPTLKDILVFFTVDVIGHIGQQTGTFTGKAIDTSKINEVEEVVK